MLLRRFISFWLYPALSLVLLLSLPRLGYRVDPGILLLWGIAGLLVWTAIEYALHRFVFHWIPSNRAVRRFLAKLHLRHHGAPRELDHLFVRPQYSLPISGLLLAGWTALLGWPAAVGLMVGSWAGFLYYETVHYRIHLSKRSGGLLDYQRRRHFYHHFIDDEFCYGVTSPLWDWVFGTYRSLEEDAPR